jgi:peptide/nickel transport system substrate-binding protein
MHGRIMVYVTAADQAIRFPELTQAEPQTHNRAMNRWKLTALTVLLAGLAAPALADTPKDTIVMVKQIDDIVSLDPAEAYEISGAEVVGNAYDRLVDYDPAAPGKIKPALATSWQIDPDGKTFTFILRAGVHFESGALLTAADAAFSLRRAVEIDKAPAVTLNAVGLTKDNVADAVVALDEHALQIKLPKALAPSFVLFCLTSLTGSILDSKTVLAHETDKDRGLQWLAGHWAGTGPYRLVMWRPNEYYALEANPNYWGGKPKIGRIIVRDVKDAETQRLMLQRGDADYARDLDKVQLDALTKEQGIAFDKGIKTNIAYLGLNQKNPNLSKPEVIEALKYLVDYDAIAGAILGDTVVVHQSFEPAGFLGAIEDKPYKFDLAKAKALLAKAGLADGFNVSMDVRNGSPWPEIAQAIQASFGQAEINLELIPGDGKQVLTKYRARHHDIFLGDWAPDYPDPHSNAEGFISNPDNADDATMRTPAWRNFWRDAAMNDAVAAALVERDDGKRAGLYEGLQREFLRKAPFVILFERVEVAARRGGVSGLGIGVNTLFDRYDGIAKH